METALRLINHARGVAAGVSIYKIAQWLGDDVRFVQQHYAKLLPKDADIEAAF